ncbi:hypothetical protein HPP92_002801 [Vanilla planifolia]|uniref:J domain-containing protein n=1 Tax=Vanilla planifolia TaxID=51239 RepID=A0A835S257_VANPL|nr:hypothetical protein HPP92_002801 [Vanilla planifolia]
MECNRDEAIRAKEIAERKVNEKDYAGAKKFALKAHNLFPTLEGINQMIATLDVYLASETNVNGEKDLYAVLCVNSLADEETVKKQYRKLALLLHPDKNKSAGAEGAFQLVSEAWSVLSDRTKKLLYDQKISLKKLQQKSSQPNKTTSAPKTSTNGFYQFANGPTAKVWPQQGIPQRPPPATSPTCHPQPPQPPTFWTSCAGCCMQYEYHRMYLNKSLLCPKCRKPFQAKELPAPPSIPHPPKASSQQSNLSNKYKNPNRSSTAPPSMGATGFQHGVNANSFSESKVQWSPFSGAATAAGVNNSSAAVAQAANVVQKAYEKAKKAARGSTSSSQKGRGSSEEV